MRSSPTALEHSLQLRLAVEWLVPRASERERATKKEHCGSVLVLQLQLLVI